MPRIPAVPNAGMPLKRSLISSSFPAMDKSSFLVFSSTAGLSIHLLY
jgi:hypothetical protein